jgi:hypothetical protein
LIDKRDDLADAQNTGALSVAPLKPTSEGVATMSKLNDLIQELCPDGKVVLRRNGHEKDFDFNQLRIRGIDT